MDDRFAESFFTMFDDRRELWQGHEFERFHEVFFFAGSGSAAASFATGVGFFPMHPFPDEIGGPSAHFVGGFEDDSVSKIEHGDLSLFLGSKSREERELGLGCHHGGGVGLAD